MITDSPIFESRIQSLTHDNSTSIDPDWQSTRPSHCLSHRHYVAVPRDNGEIWGRTTEPRTIPCNYGVVPRATFSDFFDKAFDNVSSELAYHSFDLIGLQYFFEAKKKLALEECQAAYQRRIDDLQSYAEIDGFALDEASETDFWTFFRSSIFFHKAEVVLVDNGNLRAVWKDDNGDHVGLQFLGNGSVQFVIFKRRLGTRDVSRVAGIDTLDGFKKQIQVFDLKTLIYT